jgi:thiamine-monophosphate kinase
MIDISDGLIADLGHLLAASGVGCSVDPAAVPIDPDAIELLGDESGPLAFHGGEDFELLFTIAPANVEAASRLIEELGGKITTIGEITDGAKLWGGKEWMEIEVAGWDHLLNP